MARTRYLKPGFFTNEVLTKCSAHARLLFAGLWTVSDREGRLEDRPLKIHGELFPHEPGIDVNGLLEELASSGFIVRYLADGCRLIAIPTFKQHQSPHPRETASKFPGPEGALKLQGSAVELNGRALQQQDLQDLQQQQQQPGTAAAAAAENASPGEQADGQRPSTTPPGKARKPTTPPGEMQPEAIRLVEEIAARGLSRTLARSYVRSADPALIREILAFYDDELKAGRLRNPPGALRDLLEGRHEKWGFDRTEEGWARPRDSQPAGKGVETTEERLARQRREMLAAREEAKRFKRK